ncbi:MAG: maltose O-acetyltransferase [Abditibacteriota bacterium]|nr:maltose O-acetyltransferase [Abditibacteriota bacterium]
MLDGEMYNPSDEELAIGRQRARRLTRLYNATHEDEVARRIEIITELFGAVGPRVEIEPPFRCDYGENILVGDNFYANFGCIILDCARVEIGSNVLLAPNVQIYTAAHPFDAAERASGREFARPISIGDNVWVGGGAIICPGVSIGENTIIGAGSVVTKNIPANVIAAGNPCRVLRENGGA